MTRSQLTWIDHDLFPREQTLRIISLFQEKESRDELGLGSVRDSFAVGTSACGTPATVRNLMLDSPVESGPVDAYLASRDDFLDLHGAWPVRIQPLG